MGRYRDLNWRDARGNRKADSFGRGFNSLRLHQFLSSTQTAKINRSTLIFWWSDIRCHMARLYAERVVYARLRRFAAKPTSAMPSIDMVAGSGTARRLARISPLGTKLV